MLEELPLFSTPTAFALARDGAEFSMAFGLLGELLPLGKGGELEAEGVEFEC